LYILLDNKKTDDFGLIYEDLSSIVDNVTKILENDCKRVYDKINYI
jgi:hypothetical protein